MTTIKMSINIMSFAQGLIPEETRELYNMMLADWFDNSLKQSYRVIKNHKYISNKYKSRVQSVAKELENMQVNLEAFIERMVEKFNSEDSPTTNQRESNEIGWSSELSAEEQTVAEILFSKNNNSLTNPQSRNQTETDNSGNNDDKTIKSGVSEKLSISYFH